MYTCTCMYTNKLAFHRVYMCIHVYTTYMYVSVHVCSSKAYSYLAKNLSALYSNIGCLLLYVSQWNWDCSVLIYTCSVHHLPQTFSLSTLLPLLSFLIHSTEHLLLDSSDHVTPPHALQLLSLVLLVMDKANEWVCSQKLCLLLFDVVCLIGFVKSEGRIQMTSWCFSSLLMRRTSCLQFWYPQKYL